MNEFTKEELEQIQACGHYSMELRNKIQDIIDGYDAEVIEAWHCEKCGHVQ